MSAAETFYKVKVQEGKATGKNGMIMQMFK